MDPLGQDGQRDDKRDVTLDFLGKPAPVAFKSQPALPSGGGAIGVGAGPATTAAGVAPSRRRPGGDTTTPEMDPGFAAFLKSVSDQTGGSGAGDPSAPDAASISGFAPANFASFVGTLASALGAPGLVGGFMGEPTANAGKSIAQMGLKGAELGARMGSPNLSVTEGGKTSGAIQASTVKSDVGPFATLLSFLGVDPSTITSVFSTGIPGLSAQDTATLNSMAQDVMGNMALEGGKVTTGTAGAGFAGTSPGQTSLHGAQGGAAAPGGYGGYGGQSGDPSAPGAISLSGIAAAIAAALSLSPSTPAPSQSPDASVEPDEGDPGPGTGPPGDTGGPSGATGDGPY